MKKIKGFLTMLLLGLLYALGCNPNPIEVPSLYTYICNSKWDYKSKDLSVRLIFLTNGECKIHQFDEIGLTSHIYSYSILNNTIRIENDFEFIRMKIVSVTNTKLVLEGEWSYPLIYEKQC
jgi:hypothetical protein